MTAIASLPPPPQPMPMERATSLYVNGTELLTIQATPVFLEDWALGFLFTEGIIQRPEHLKQVVVQSDPIQVDAQVDSDCLQDRELAGKRYLTSGCGKGITFSSVKDAMQLRPINHTLSIRPQQIAGWLIAMQKQMPLYIQSGGMHAAAAVRIADGEILVREDIGRHNAVDKAIGASLRAGWAPEDLVILTTGRISYEMCAKLGRCGVGLGASITAVTDQALRLANKLNIDLLGYARSARTHRLYTEGRHFSATQSHSRAPVERPTTVYLNDEERLTVQTTPVDLEDWALGYLWGEGIITQVDQLRALVVDEDRGLVWIDLTPGVNPFPDGRTTEANYQSVTHGLSITKRDALVWMERMLAGAVLYHETGGVHVGAAVRVDTGAMIIREDIGRHNAIEKVIGALLSAKWPTEQVVLLTSGRISYEMSTRLARCGFGIGISRTAATDQAYHLADKLGIELVGYARSPGSLIVYTEGNRT